MEHTDSTDVSDAARDYISNGSSTGRVLPYAVTTVASAFLLFQIQPLVTKVILPQFGGSAAVWSTALVFFQVGLLAGYAYAFWLTTRFRLGTQLLVHGLLVLTSCTALPLQLSHDWHRLAQEQPTTTVLMLLLVEIGLPYFCLSASTPILQSWYAQRNGARMPYRLFALSNLASLLALLSYPLVFEPRLDLTGQAYAWSGLYWAFVLAWIHVIWVTRRAVAVRTQSTGAGPPASALPIGRLILWLILSGSASAMLAAVTNHLSTNVAPFPMMWVIPLTVYLATLIVAFSNDRYYNRALLLPWLLSSIGWMAFAISANGGNLHLAYQAPLCLAGLLLCCWLCHGELARSRPSVHHLAMFYVIVALGGACGTTLVAIVSPKIFDTALELPLLLVAMGLLSTITIWRRQGSTHSVWTFRAALLGGVALLAGYLGKEEIASRDRDVLAARNFYGVLRVRDEAAGTPRATRMLLSGTITHGSQFLDAAYSDVPGTYYGPSSGVARAMRALQEQAAIRYGVIGLGAGVMSAYARKGDYLAFYELNPTILTIANQQFTFLKHARAAGASVDVLLGDARVLLQAQESQRYDLLAVDAFSSDAIPVHLLTTESFEVYLKHLKPQGILAVHITNRYVDLEPVCLRAAEHVGRVAVTIRDQGVPGNLGSLVSTWVLIATDARFFEARAFADAGMQPTQASQSFRGWTDDYTSLWPLIKRDSFVERE